MTKEGVAVAERKLVLVVGRGSPERAAVARRLISDDRAVVLCPGPPGCPLVRAEPCVLTASADVTVVMPGTSRDPQVLTGLRLCGASSDRVIRPLRRGSSSVDPADVSEAVRRCFDEDQRRSGAGRRGAASEVRCGFGASGDL